MHHPKIKYQSRSAQSTMGSATPFNNSIPSLGYDGYRSFEIAPPQDHDPSISTYDIEAPITPQSRDRLVFPNTHSTSAKAHSLSKVSLPMSHHSRSFSVPVSSRKPSNLELFNILPNGHIRSASGAPHVVKHPQVPKIPQKFYHHNRNNSWADAQPILPESRPSMPPTAFWIYAAEQQTRGASAGKLQRWQVNSHEWRDDPSLSRYPIAPNSVGNAVSKEQARQWKNLASKTSYENSKLANTQIDNLPCSRSSSGKPRDTEETRKQSYSHVDGSFEERRSKSRKLVKKRLVCDGDLRYQGVATDSLM